jgi:hypothetical protein
MARPRKTKPTLPMHIGREPGNGPVLIPASVPDPYEPDKPLRVVKNARSSAVYTLYVRKRLGPPDDAEARLEAAKRFMAVFERAEIGGASAIDYSRAKVDVSFRYSGVADSTIEAIRELADIRASLRRHYPLIEKVCGVGLSLDEVARSIQGGAPSWRTKAQLSDWLRDGLDMLIDHFGVACGPKRARMRAERATEEAA